ncbi:hypothetical protein LUZ63_012288 [Rhynchospora breviuscula]|uniref:Histidine-containing phosphotransfer protein n=1 Tax=Rhynchospora breviuscula TaxID=2022672 RepID=A0A9Q0CKH3_9POAL|nr:hypothetical protein LUZ63_012288 [Rhynchospora breviuscula]
MRVIGRAMDVNRLQQTYSNHFLSLFDEGILNQQFKELRLLQDDNNPTFLFEIVSLFTESAGTSINEIRSYCNQPATDFIKIKALLFRLKGSSQSLGAQNVEIACENLRNGCDEYDLQNFLSCMEQLNLEFLKFKTKLETLFKLEQQIVAAGGSIPNIQ